MYKIKIITVGKIKEKWLNIAIDEYLKRLSNLVEIKWLFLKNDEKLISLCIKEKSFVCLDICGKRFSSEKFSLTIQNLLEKQKHNLTFVIGGAEGIPEIIRSKANLLISFSDLTFTHQIVRLILLEQIYRSFEIAKGSNYHK